MERTLEVRTGESIEIRYELAGLGSRFLAVALDLTIQIGITVAFLLVLALITGPLSAATGTLVPAGSLGKTARAIVGAVGVFAIFVVYFGYFIIFELWWSGRTPGKRALGIRVVRDAGFPIDVGSAVIRNLVRVLEFGLAFYTFSAVSALFSRQNKRLGDFAAGTIVVRDGRYAPATLDAYLARESPEDDGLTQAQRDVAERYVTRRSQLEFHARERLAAQLAASLRPHLRANFEHLGDDELLGHLGRGAAKRD